MVQTTQNRLYKAKNIVAAEHTITRAPPVLAEEEEYQADVAGALVNKAVTALEATEQYYWTLLHEHAA